MSDRTPSTPPSITPLLLESSHSNQSQLDSNDLNTDEIDLNELTVSRREGGYIANSNLLLFALAIAFFPRVLMLLKFPSIINFLHFAIVPLVFAMALAQSKSRDRQQIRACQQILVAMLLLLTVGFASGLFNEAGLINVVLHFLLFAEPFMLVVAMVCLPLTTAALLRMRHWILGFGFANLILALIQKFILNWDTCGCSPGGWGDGDAIKGVFINQGSGHVVGASVSIALATHYFVAMRGTRLKQKRRGRSHLSLLPDHSVLLRMVVVMAGLVHVIASDAKQVLLVGAIAFVLLSFVNVKDIVKAILYFIAIGLVIYGFIWAVGQFEFLSSYQTWARPEIYGADGDATVFKLSGIRIISSHLKSPIQWWLGLGPGHTVDRLGGWMLKDYGDLLNPLGATRTSIADEVWQWMSQSWLANGSSMFAPFFGWAAIWGDIGILGLIAYLYLAYLVWHYLCLDDLSKFQVLNIFVHGLIFTQMQEPGYMLFMAALIGLRWQELRHNSH
jgi:hypothetical protein